MVDTRQLGQDRLIWANIFPWLLPEINCLSSSLLLAAIKGHLGSRISRTMFWQRRSQNLGSGFQSDYQKWLSLFSGTVVVHLLLEKHYGTWVIVFETKSHVHLNELTASYSTPAPLQPLSEASVLEQPPPFCTPPPKKRCIFFWGKWANWGLKTLKETVQKNRSLLYQSKWFPTGVGGHKYSFGHPSYKNCIIIWQCGNTIGNFA